MLARRTIPALTLVAAFLAVFAGQVSGQCILANPSFEVGGSGGPVFGGWNQFGVVGSSAEAYHGSVAARVSGPNYGGWDVSAYWQSQDSEPGEQWEITGHVRHPGSNPLTGQCAALVNVEWHNDVGDMIDYDSFTVADASSPTDEYIDFSVTSSPAPAGTASIHLLFGVLQSPTDPSPDVEFDQVTCYSTSPPTIDDVQWNDFPSGRTLEFAGRSWRVKGPGWFGPGYNYFGHTESNVWVDVDERLHLSLKLFGSTWVCTEVTLEEPLGYGDYVFTTRGDLDLLDSQVVLGMFLWQYGPCYDDAYLWWNPYNEFDIEYSRWGNPSDDLGQFVAQPWYWAGNRSRYAATFDGDEVASHAFRWLPDSVECRSWRGGPDDESPENMIHQWTYTGPHIPRPEQPRVHLNLWLIDGAPTVEQEVVFDDFTFIPAGPTHVGDGSDDRIPAAAAGRLRGVSPNPFNPQTTVSFDLRREGVVDLGVYDLNGRLVNNLVNGFRTAGEHRAVWDGTDQRGRRRSSGVYLIRLRGEDYVESRQVSLIK